MATTNDGIRVLHVDDEPDFVELVAEMLAREDDRITVETATSANEGLDRVTEETLDCIVSDYDMPGQNGIEFLETVRGEYPNLPFILYTGKGSEQVASHAISAGATDYLQKGSGTDQYELLANRIQSAVEQFRAQQRAAELERIRRLVNDINQALVRANSRSEVETQLCEIITEPDPYLFAWIGEVDAETDRVEPRAWAGVEDGYLDAITVTADETATGRGPTGTAIRERQIAVSQNLQEDAEYEPWREAALDRGYQSSAAVPLEYRDTLHGTLHVYADSPDAFNTDEQEVLVELGNDIGHAIHAQEAEEELNKRSEAMEASMDGMAILDENEEYVYVNDGHARIYGYDSPEEVLGKSWKVLYDEEEFERFENEIMPQFKYKGRWKGEAVGKKKDGTKFPQEVSLTALEDGGIICVVRDITERKEAEEKIEELAKEWRSTFDTMEDMIFVLDKDHEIEKANESLLNAVGLTEEEIIGKKCYQLIHDKDKPIPACPLEKSLKTGETEEEEIHEPNFDAHFLVKTQPLVKKDGEIEKIVHQIQDITERKKTEEREDFLHSLLRHDVGNKSRVVEGYLELLEDFDLPEEAEQYVEKARQGSQENTELIEEVRTLIKAQKEQVEEVDITSAIHNTVNQVKNMAEEAGMEIEVQCPGEGCMVKGGPLVNEIFSNLLENSIRHSDGNRVRTRGEVTENEVTYIIEDDGRGIPDEEKDQVFEKGYTTDEERGTGLGMFLVKTILDIYGGSVEAKDSELGGARFDVHLKKA